MMVMNRYARFVTNGLWERMHKLVIPFGGIIASAN